jgi:anti-sigma factor RsiW
MMQQSKIPNNSHIDDELLSERMDDLLAPAEVRRVDDHLALCDECAARYAGLQATRAVLRSLRVEAAPRDFRLDAAHLSQKKVVAIRPANMPQRWLSVAALICGICLLVFGVFITVAPSTIQFSAALDAHQPAASSANCTTCRTQSVPGTTNVPNAGVSSTDKTPQAIKTVQATQTPDQVGVQTPVPALTTPTYNTNSPSSGSIVPFLIITLGLLVMIAGAAGVFYTRPR